MSLITDKLIIRSSIDRAWGLGTWGKSLNPKIQFEYPTIGNGRSLIIPKVYSGSRGEVADRDWLGNMDAGRCLTMRSKCPMEWDIPEMKNKTPRVSRDGGCHWYFCG